MEHDINPLVLIILADEYMERTSIGAGAHFAHLPNRLVMSESYTYGSHFN